MKQLAFNVLLSVAVITACIALGGDYKDFDSSTWVVFAIVAIGVGVLMWLRDVQWNWMMGAARRNKPDEDERP